MSMVSGIASLQSPRLCSLHLSARVFPCGSAHSHHGNERGKVLTLWAHLFPPRQTIGFRYKDEGSKTHTMWTRVFPCYCELEEAKRHVIWAPLLTCCYPHHEDKGAKRHLILGTCILPFCLALLLAKACQTPGAAFALTENQVATPFQYKPLSERETEVHISFTSRVDLAISCLERGKQAQAQGDFSQALLWYTQIIEENGDLALAEYARVGRAITLYEVGDKEEAFVEMEDASLSLKGYPEVHAALAAALYADKNLLLAAERQFTIATLLDPHYTDVSYVKDIKHWPPSLVTSLEKFINFQ